MFRYIFTLLALFISVLEAFVEEVELFHVPQGRSHNIPYGSILRPNIPTDLSLISLPKDIDLHVAAFEARESMVGIPHSKRVMRDVAVALHVCNVTNDRLEALASWLEVGAVVIFLDDEQVPIMTAVDTSPVINTSTQSLCIRRTRALRAYLLENAVKTAVFFALTSRNMNILSIVSGTYTPTSISQQELFSSDIPYISLPTISSPLLPSPLMTLSAPASLTHATELANFLISPYTDTNTHLMHSASPTVYITAQYQSLELVPGLTHANTTHGESIALPLLLLAAQTTLSARTPPSLATSTHTSSPSTHTDSPSASTRTMSSPPSLPLHTPHMNTPATKLVFAALPAPLYAAAATLTHNHIVSRPQEPAEKVLALAAHVHIAVDMNARPEDTRTTQTTTVPVPTHLSTHPCTGKLQLCPAPTSAAVKHPLAPLLARILAAELRAMGMHTRVERKCVSLEAHQSISKVDSHSPTPAPSATTTTTSTSTPTSTTTSTSTSTSTSTTTSSLPIIRIVLPPIHTCTVPVATALSRALTRLSHPSHDALARNDTHTRQGRGQANGMGMDVDVVFPVRFNDSIHAGIVYGADGGSDNGSDSGSDSGSGSDNCVYQHDNRHACTGTNGKKNDVSGKGNQDVISRWLQAWSQWLSIASTPHTASLAIPCVFCPWAAITTTGDDNIDVMSTDDDNFDKTTVSDNSNAVEGSLHVIGRNLLARGNYTIVELVSAGLKSMEGLGKSTFFSGIPPFDRYGVRLWSLAGSPHVTVKASVKKNSVSDTLGGEMVEITSPGVMYTVKADQFEYIVSILIAMFLLLLSIGLRKLKL